MGFITWTKSWSSADNGAVFRGTDLQNLQNDITSVVNGGLTDVNIKSNAGIQESKISFDTLTGHNHDGSNSRLAAAGATDAISRGLELSVTKDDAYITVKPGQAWHGTTSVLVTTDVVLNFGSAADWYDGSVDSYSGGADWCYVGYNRDGEIKFLGNNPPDVDDSNGNNVSGATKLYFDDTGGGSGEYWRVIGAVRVNTSNEVEKTFYQVGDWVMWDVPIVITTTPNTAWTTADCSDAIPAFSQLAQFGLAAYAGGGIATLHIRPNGGTWSTQEGDGINTNNVSGWLNLVMQQMTDSSQQIEYRSYNSDTTSIRITVHGYYIGSIR